MLSTVYSKLGNYKKAWQYQNRYIHIKDSIYNENRTKHIEELKTKYETEKKEKEIALLKKDKKIQDSELKQSAIIRNSLIAIIALVLIFTVIYYIRFKKTVRLSRKLQEKNQEIERQKEEIAQQSSNLREINSLLITKNEEIKKHQEHLQEVNEMKDRIFSIIGHDLKSPVATLKNSFELLMKGDYDKDKIREFHEMMYENISPIYNLLENLLLWAKNQQNDITFKPKQCNLQEIINDNIKLLNNNAKQKQITLEAEYDGSLEAEVDYNMISTVVRNLLSNAIKFSYPGNDVLVKAHSGNNKVIISVNDKGMGISEEELNKILHTDQHFSKRGTEKEKGSGLGLNICKKFIQLHNGTFNAFSEEGTGSQFIFTIPKSQFNAV
jgi:signal transduction histidine kinase